MSHFVAAFRGGRVGLTIDVTRMGLGAMGTRGIWSHFVPEVVSFCWV